MRFRTLYLNIFISYSVLVVSCYWRWLYRGWVESWKVFLIRIAPKCFYFVVSFLCLFDVLFKFYRKFSLKNLLYSNESALILFCSNATHIFIGKCHSGNLYKEIYGFYMILLEILDLYINETFSYILHTIIILKLIFPGFRII